MTDKAFSIPFEPVRPMSQEELASLQEPVLAWAMSLSLLDDQTLRNGLHLEEGWFIPVYTLTLRTLLETREIFPEMTAQPLTAGFQPAAKPLSRQEVNLWEAAGPPAGFEEGRAQKFLPATAVIKDCLTCARQGTSVCDRCSGERIAGCAACDGKGHRPCESCHGATAISCLHCTGTGLRESKSLRVSEADDCPSCKGKGKTPCGRCSSGRWPCDACEGRGSGPCGKCDSKGALPCHVCGGAGQVLSGWSYIAESRVQQSLGAAALEQIPPALMNGSSTSGEKSKAAVHPLETPLTEDVASGADLPGALRNLLMEQLHKLKPLLSVRTRATKQEIHLAKDEVVRVRGSFDGREFNCWMNLRDQKIVSPHNPFQSFVDNYWQDAKAAAGKGLWNEAVALAQKTLTYDPSHADAAGLIRTWKIKILRESLLASLAAGVLAAALAAAYIFVAGKGLHKGQPAVKVVFSFISLGLILGLAWIPLIRNKTAFLARARVSFGGTLAVLVLLAGVARGVFRWDGVRAADEAAFARDYAEAFPMGTSQVFHEPDLRKLQELADRYRDTAVDLAPVEADINRQKALQRERMRFLAEYRREMENILGPGSRMKVQDKILRLRQVRDFYKLRSIDVTPAEEALEKLESEYQKVIERPRSRISITSVAPAAPQLTPRERRRAGAAARKEAAAREKAKKAALKKKSATPASSKKAPSKNKARPAFLDRLRPI
jgi:hypothetical protein